MGLFYVPRHGGTDSSIGQAEARSGWPGPWQARAEAGLDQSQASVGPFGARCDNVAAGAAPTRFSEYLEKIIHIFECFLFYGLSFGEFRRQVRSQGPSTPRGRFAALGTPRGLDAPSPVRVALNRPPREEQSLLADWLGDDPEAGARPGRPSTREFASTDLAQRLTRPVAAAGVSEVAR